MLASWGVQYAQKKQAWYHLYCSVLHRVQKKVAYFVFERNFATTGSIFLQFSVTITEQLVYN